MPTSLEKAFLADIISNLDSRELRRLLRAVGDKAFEIVAKEALNIKGGRKRAGREITGRRDRRTPRPHINRQAPAPSIHRSTLNSPEVCHVIESDLESYTLSDDETSRPKEDNATTTESSTHVRPAARSTDAAEQRLHRLLHGARPASKEMLKRLANIIDGFDWKKQTRKDFLRLYIRKVMSREDRKRMVQPAQSWCAMVRIHGKRLRAYSANFALMYSTREDHRATKSMLPAPTRIEAGRIREKKQRKEMAVSESDRQVGRSPSSMKLDM